MEEQEVKHVRRVRYKGTHPRKFSEKYKELQPEKYADEVAEIIKKGKTPAGMHISICVPEILEFLNIKPGETGFDATLGYGGHSEKMLECLKGAGHLYAVDVDAVEIDKTRKRLEALGYGPDILTIYNMNFMSIGKVAEEARNFDFVLADLGVSSMQIDNPERGFSYKREGPLDLRLNPLKGITAAERLNSVTEAELERMLIDNSDEPYAKEITRAVIKEKKSGKDILTTKQLSDTVVRALSFLPIAERSDMIKKSCQRVFQALRIDVNKEFEVLSAFLEKLPKCLRKGGRAAILTFHSGEDRLVKKAFKQGLAEGLYSKIAEDVIRPSMEECRVNPRAHSAKMRWVIKA